MVDEQSTKWQICIPIFDLQTFVSPTAGGEPEGCRYGPNIEQDFDHQFAPDFLNDVTTSVEPQPQVRERVNSFFLPSTQKTVKILNALSQNLIPIQDSVPALSRGSTIQLPSSPQ